MERLTENAGYTETAARARRADDPLDAPLDLFPEAPPDAQTTTVFDGVHSVTASSYGSPITYLPTTGRPRPWTGTPDRLGGCSEVPPSASGGGGTRPPDHGGPINLTQPRHDADR